MRCTRGAFQTDSVNGNAVVVHGRHYGTVGVCVGRGVNGEDGVMCQFTDGETETLKGDASKAARGLL